MGYSRSSASRGVLIHVRFHSSSATHYVHEIIHLLLWAFPKNPKDKNKGDEKTSETPETLLPLIRDDVVALYNALGPNALPIKINDYPPYFTDTKSHRILPIVIGKGKERLGQAKREYVKRTPAAKAAQGSGTVNVESADDEDGVRTARKGRPRNVEDWEVSEKPVKKMAERAACWWDKHGTKEDLAERFVHRELRPRIGDFVVVNEPDAYLPKRPEVVVAFRKSTSGEPSNETLKRFESCKVDAKHKEGFVINVSGAVWGLEWCPGIPSERRLPYFIKGLN